jgi:DNA-binding NarL/FixJ family response regulator
METEVPSRTKRVILADDHSLVRSGLAALLKQTGRFEIVGEARDGVETIEIAARVECDLLIIDLAMPRLGGIETIQRVREKHKCMRILVLSMYDDAQFVARALREGANGYLLKNAVDDDLFHAIDHVLHGDLFVSEGIDQHSLLEFTHDDSELTSRELEVLHLIADGMTNSEIADALLISPHTANRHRANLMKKLDVHNRVELVNAANSRGLVPVPKRQ